MPELPEVETIRRTLLEHAIGYRVRRVQVFQPSVIHSLHKFPPKNKLTEELFRGSLICNCLRKGKQLALVSDDDRFLRIQLGMTGQILIGERKSPALARHNHVHIVWHLHNEKNNNAPPLLMKYRDIRRFGRVWTACTDAELQRTWDKLGYDALSITTSELADALKRTNRPIKAALLDQNLIAGIGNIYADESLFAASVHPLTPTNLLTRQQFRVLARCLRKVLRESIEYGGSTLRDYVDASGEKGSFQNRHRVYGRAGQPCCSCGEPLQKIRLAGRTTVFCPDCQHLPAGF